MFRKTSVGLAALVLLLVACGPTRYAYAPVTTTSAEVVGHPTADHPFPPDSPHGEVRLATFGITQIVSEGPWFFHVRMSATNQGDVPWVIDKAEQVLEVRVADDGEHKALVRAATSVDSSPARVEIAPGRTASMDFFFPLPPGAKDASDVPGFQVMWSVRDGDRIVTMATPFQRFLASGAALDVPKAQPSYPYGNGTQQRLPGTPDSRPRYQPVPPTIDPSMP